MNRRPTAKAVIVVAVGGVLVAVGTTAQAGWLFVLAAGVLGLAASGLVVSHRLASVELVRSFPARARVGETVPVRLAVRASGKRRLPLMRVEDGFPAFDPIAVASEPVRVGGEAVVDVHPVAVRRGIFEEGPVRFTTAAPFGLTRTKRDATFSSRLIVHPAWVELRRYPLPESPATFSDEAVAVARAGHGEVFAGVRDYRPGDPQRFVHWKTTARTGRLVVREHEEPARSPVVVVLSGDPGPGAETVWETLVAAAASVGVYALSEGRPVHCVTAGSSGFLEDATKTSLLDWSAGVDPSDVPVAPSIAAAARRWGSRCSYVIFGVPGDATDGAVAEAQRRGAAVKVVYGVAKGSPPPRPMPARTLHLGEDLRTCLEG